MKILFDIDDTLMFTSKRGDYSSSEPMEGMVEMVNDLYDKGHNITMFTARGMGRHKGNVEAATAEFYQLTFDSLTKFGFKFHRLLLGKPDFDIALDDKVYNVNCEYCLNKFEGKITSREFK